MAEVLSQNEIDSLLNALSGGEVDADEIKESHEKSRIRSYDFSRPSKFSKEHLRTLEIIFEHYGRLLEANLPSYLRKNVQVDVINSEAITYFEFTNSFSNPVALGIINLSPLQGSIILEIDAGLGFSIVDRMLGGVGRPLDKHRDFSEIETLILERIMKVCTELLQEPWKNVVDLRPTLERMETSAQFAQIISPTDMVALITLGVKMGDVDGLINVCMPYLTLDDIMDRLSTKYWFSSVKSQGEEGFKADVETLIGRASIPVKAVLGKSIVSVTDFVNLQVGDIIRLNTRLEQELDIYVGNIRKFTALPGESGSQYAVRVTSIIREEQ